MLIHGSCAARQGDGVLILGPPGSGKSDLVLRLMQAGWLLVADDQVEVSLGESAPVATSPPALAGLLEVRGLGIFEALPAGGPVPLRLAVHLASREQVARLPQPARWREGGASLPLIALDPFEASACAKLGLALDAATGRARQRAGAFAP